MHLKSIDIIPTFKFDQIYSDSFLKYSKAALYSEAINFFSQKFDDLPQWIARAPGRVTLMGKHIDYSGFGVLPFALQREVVLLFKTNNHGKIRFSNVDSKRFETADFELDPESWKTASGAWTGYILWGFKAILSLIGKKSNSKIFF